MSLLFGLLALALHGDKAKPDLPPICISGVATQEPVVALTFDACATRKQANGFDHKVFEILEREKIPVTFYLTGAWAEKHPSAVKQIAAASWVEIGNHGYSHARLTLLRPDRLRTQIRYTERILERKLGRRALSLRPPAGAWNQNVARAANREGLPLVLWSVVSGDAGGHLPVQRVDSAVLDQTKPGSIVVFHINQRAPFTKKALPDIIAGLRAKGFRFVTVSQLLALPDAVPMHAQPSRLGCRRLKSRRPTGGGAAANTAGTTSARGAGAKGSAASAPPAPAPAREGEADENPPS
jgi:peptidoglycan/xylan/chitin deacetylase (PgdA/CDA1 family)